MPLLGLLGGCDGGIQLHKLEPDTGPARGCEPVPETLEPDGGACPPGPQGQLLVCRQPEAGWAVLVGEGQRYRSVELVRPRPNQAAAAIDWTDADGRVAGVLLAMNGTRPDPRSQARELVQRIQTAGAFRDVTLRYPGDPLPPGAARPAWTGLVLTIELASAGELHRVRSSLYPALLGLDIAQVRGVPEDPRETSDRFTLVLGVRLEPDGRITVAAGLTTADSYANRLSKARLRAHDLAALALVGAQDATPRRVCRRLRFAHPLEHEGQVDLLWVVRGTEGAEMSAHRIRLLQAVSPMWSRAQALGLDLRMGVTSMDRDQGGELCAPEPGADGALWPGDDQSVPLVQACLLQPRGARASEQPDHGLLSGRRGLTRLLPRQAVRPDRLRPQARPAVAFVSDVEDHEVAELFGGAVPATLSAEDRELLMGHLAPYINILREAPKSGSGLEGTLTLALVGDPMLQGGCGGRRGTGYLEVVEALGGRQDLICQPDEPLDAVLEGMAEHLARVLSALELGPRPIPSTLSATLDGEALFRSLSRGVAVDAATGKLLLPGLSEPLSAGERELRVSYLSW